MARWLSTSVLIVVWEVKHEMVGLSGDADGLGRDKRQPRRGMLVIGLQAAALFHLNQ